MYNEKRNILRTLTVIILMLLVCVVAWGEENDNPTVFCPECGTSNQLGGKFCSSCGADLPQTVQQEKPIIVTDTPVSQVEEIQIVEDTLQFQDMSREELIKIVNAILVKVKRTENMQKLEMKRVGGMTRTELEILIKTLLEENSTTPKGRRTSGFGKFLQVVGIVSLAVLSIAVLSTLMI